MHVFPEVVLDLALPCDSGFRGSSQVYVYAYAPTVHINRFVLWKLIDSGGGGLLVGLACHFSPRTRLTLFIWLGLRSANAGWIVVGGLMAPGGWSVRALRSEVARRWIALVQ